MDKTFFFKSLEEDVIDYDKIAEIQRLRNESKNISIRINALSVPLLTDLDMLENVYKEYLSVVSARIAPPAHNRKKFLLASLWLFSPKTLAGCKMRSGMREKLAEILNIKSPSLISDNCDNLIILYRTYREFRQDVNIIVKKFAH